MLKSKNTYDHFKKMRLERKQERLSNKYKEKTYQEKFEILYNICKYFSFLFNGISILTASSFVFAYVLSIVASLPYPTYIALFFTLLVLFVIEILQRTFAPIYFREKLQYGESSIITIILILSSFSITLSYLGSPDFISIVSKAPVYQSPELVDIQATKSDYDAQIKQAQSSAENYRVSKLWQGRLSDSNAKVYRSLLSDVQKLRNKKNDNVTRYQESNTTTLSQAKTRHQDSLLAFNGKVKAKGTGLGILAIIAQVFFFLCIFYVEYYEFRMYLEMKPKKLSNDEDYEFSSNGHAKNYQAL